jgi:tRNA(Arg) A34 adenosine deaminase TadA
MQQTKNPNSHAEILAINLACLELGNKNEIVDIKYTDTSCMFIYKKIY